MSEKSILPSHCHCVLVVQNNVLERTAISGHLRHCECRVIDAVSAEGAMESLDDSAFVFDAVLFDSTMPEWLNGFGLLQWVRDNKPKVAVIFASAREKACRAAANLGESMSFCKSLTEPTKSMS